MSGFELPLPVVVLGLTVGLTYGLLAVGLVLVFRSTGVVNFAHGQIGVFGATVLVVAVTEVGVPYWVAFAAAVVTSAAIAAAVDAVILRRLRGAPRLMGLVATLGVAEVLLLLGFVLNAEGAAGQFFPQPALPALSVGAVRLTPAHVGMLVLTPVLVGGLAVFLRSTKVGIATRAAAANADTARLDGVRAARMGTLAWALAGGVSAVTAVLVLPSQGFVTGEAMGPGLLVRALVAAVVARMEKLPTALGAGVAVGVVDQALQWNYPDGGVVEAVMLAAVLLVLLVQRAQRGRRGGDERWDVLQAWTPLPREALRLPWVRHGRALTAAVGLALALLVPAVVSNRTASVLVTIIAYTLVGLSVGVVTGLSGQLSLGQFGLAAVGAVVSYHVTRTTGNFVLGAALAGSATAMVSVAVGLPALRIRGLMLAVATLAFAVAAQTWFLRQPWTFGSGVDPGYPLLGGFGFDTAKRYYLFALPFLVVGFWLAANVRFGALGRRLRAVRDHADGARAFGIATTRVQLQAFAVAGFLAGIGGAVYAHSLSLVSAQAFGVRISIDLVAMAVLGGIDLLAGPLLGALYIVGVPNLLPLDEAGLAATSVGWLVLVVQYPGGLAELVGRARDRLVARALARTARVDAAGGAHADAAQTAAGGATAEGAFAGVDVRATVVREPARAPAAPGTAASAGAALPLLLETAGLVKRYGGITAVDGVDLGVVEGEALGLIGPNGAGKTTLFELLGGFELPDDGTITFAGVDVTRAPAHARARLGVVRSFQEARLFPTLTVVETVTMALELAHRPSTARELVGWDPIERRRRARAEEVVGAMGLDRYRDAQVRALSTGTRRIVDLACAVALEPRLLLLDEPSAGVAQRETEALGALLLQIRQALGATIVLIEHDIPMVSAVADRLVAMESGRVIAVGTPQEVTAHPRVVEAYLGGDAVAVQRSGRVAVPAAAEVGV